MKNLEGLRGYEQRVVTAPESVSDGEVFIIAYFDESKDYNLNGILGIIRTFFICAVLTLSSLFFTKDATELVLTPIENMLFKIKQIAKNPLKSTGSSDRLENLQLEITQMEEKKKQTKTNANFETAVLERTIVKIGALLALGFGEAGAEIIGLNMNKSGEVDPMVAGKKIYAIYGFCDIRNFAHATEVLQEGVMVFVNEIAEIVHEVVDFHGGAPNKNIGEAFLIIWKFEDDDIIYSANDNEITLKKNSQRVKVYTELAVVAFLKVQGEIASTPTLEKVMNLC